MTRILWSFTAAAALCGVLAATAPAHAFSNANAITHNAITHNAITHNAITHNSLIHNSLVHNGRSAAASQLDDLNGVTVEAVVLPDQPAR